MKLILLKQVTERTGLGGSSINNCMAAGYFPRPVKLGPRLVAWGEEEIDEWIADKISKQDTNRD
ncbi:AlpA family phage regulatory protein [Shewanella litorisediminis]|uniref:AlpA family transcriptional regulator n=1 Tax=Shewanella litorisediminis TaxID=1173586 RepID=A0ABX7G024_9GAMM|nr:AlpA family transcriptional regulator [Shewanella litorisediminis]MCL2918281.1 AlpA family transcriptional regulator [Shewanella litorisediminis]QRH00670.1 AlpA family transcriptional regulator [Shewanella litorisediminis]